MSRFCLERRTAGSGKGAGRWCCLRAGSRVHRRFTGAQAGPHSPSSSRPLGRRARPCLPGICPEKEALEDKGSLVCRGCRTPGRTPKPPIMGAVAGPWCAFCLCSSWLKLAGAIQLTNNLPLWAYFYLGLVPSTQTHMWLRATCVSSGNNRHSRRHRCQAGTRGDRAGEAVKGGHNSPAVVARATE